MWIFKKSRNSPDVIEKQKIILDLLEGEENLPQSAIPTYQNPYTRKKNLSLIGTHQDGTRLLWESIVSRYIRSITKLLVSDLGTVYEALSVARKRSSAQEDLFDQSFGLLSYAVVEGSRRSRFGPARPGSELLIGRFQNGNGIEGFEDYAHGLTSLPNLASIPSESKLGTASSKKPFYGDYGITSLNSKPVLSFKTPICYYYGSEMNL
ncbi:hypothetical protein GYMLUDRAFT_62427 [Collybiopsis luxurians FD-317 M1]|uniref:Uncharacterized protein n=1 Tax=Collybiopsis luxurians FD-317 M1 TaxID=944289 RepID=A0A0D0CKM0_9AGAR|nr:hypothetical protein GYMLUDRAFT_62427 [Collybiopsis luxurians FD-317 M1]